MKKTIKLTALFLSLVMCLSFLFSCNNKLTEPTETTDATINGETEPPQTEQQPEYTMLRDFFWINSYTPEEAHKAGIPSVASVVAILSNQDEIDDFINKYTPSKNNPKIEKDDTSILVISFPVSVCYDPANYSFAVKECLSENQLELTIFDRATEYEHAHYGMYWIEINNSHIRKNISIKKQEKDAIYKTVELTNFTQYKVLSPKSPSIYFTREMTSVYSHALPYNTKPPEVSTNEYPISMKGLFYLFNEDFYKNHCVYFFTAEIYGEITAIYYNEYGITFYYNADSPDTIFDENTGEPLYDIQYFVVLPKDALNKTYINFLSDSNLEYALKPE